VKNMTLKKSLWRLFTFPLLLVLIFVVAGCFSSTPPPASVLHADTYTAVASKDERTLPVVDKVLTVEDAVRIGLANSPTYELAKLAIDSAYNEFYQTLFNYLPTASVTAGGLGGIEQTQVISRGDSRWGSSTSLSSPNLAAEGTFTIFSGLSRELNLLASYEGLKDTKQALKFSRLSLIKQITNLYYELVLHKAKIAIDEANLSFQEEMLENTRYRYKNNLVTYDYVLNFEFAYKFFQARLVDERRELKTNEYALAALLGLTTAELPKNTKYQSIDELIKNLKHEYSSLGVEFYLDLAIDQRPDLKQIRFALKKLRFGLYAAWGAFSPTISATASYGLTTADWEYTNQDFGYGIGINWNIVDSGFSRIFNVRKAQIEVAKGKLNVLKTWIKAVKEVRTAYLDLQAYMRQEELETEAVKIAERQREMVKVKYENQLESISRLNQVQYALVDAQLDRATAIINVYKSKTNLNFACGIQRY